MPKVAIHSRKWIGGAALANKRGAFVVKLRSRQRFENNATRDSLSRNSRTLLRRLLTKKFGSMPESLVQRIEATSDLERLQACAEQVVDMKMLEELTL